MKINENMQKLIESLKKGLNGIIFPEVKPSCYDDWNENYAVIQDVYFDDCYNDYFDDHKFSKDLNQFLIDHFKEDEELVVVRADEPYGHKWVTGTVVINYRKKCNEIEVYRQK